MVIGYAVKRLMNTAPVASNLPQQGLGFLNRKCTFKKAYLLVLEQMKNGCLFTVAKLKTQQR